jgi:hypothetical protein
MGQNDPESSIDTTEEKDYPVSYGSFMTSWIYCQSCFTVSQNILKNYKGIKVFDNTAISSFVVPVATGPHDFAERYGHARPAAAGTLIEVPPKAKAQTPIIREKLSILSGSVSFFFLETATKMIEEIILPKMMDDLCHPMTIIFYLEGQLFQYDMGPKTRGWDRYRKTSSFGLGRVSDYQRLEDCRRMLTFMGNKEYWDEAGIREKYTVDYGNKATEVDFQAKLSYLFGIGFIQKAPDSFKDIFNITKRGLKFLRGGISLVLGYDDITIRDQQQDALNAPEHIKALGRIWEKVEARRLLSAPSMEDFKLLGDGEEIREKTVEELRAEQYDTHKEEKVEAEASRARLKELLRQAGKDLTDEEFDAEMSKIEAMLEAADEGC